MGGYTESGATKRNEDFDGESAREDMLDRLTTLIKQVENSDFYLQPFGSSVSKFCSDASDFDLVLLLPDHGPDEKGNAVRQEVVLPMLQGITQQLRGRQSHNGFRFKEFIRHARVPIVSLECSTHHIPADISVNQPFGLLNSWLLRDFASESVKTMVMKIKEWAKSKGLNNARDGYLSSYGWTLLVLGFLLDKKLISNLYHGNAVPENPNPYFDSEEALQLVISAVQMDPSEPRPYIWFPCDDDEPFEMNDDLIMECLRFVADHLNQRGPAKSRKIISIRTPDESPWDDVSSYCRKQDHWNDSVYGLIEEPFSGENVARVMRVNGSYAIQKEIDRAVKAVESGSTFDEIISLPALSHDQGQGRKRALDNNAEMPAPQRTRHDVFARNLKPVSAPAPSYKNEFSRLMQPARVTTQPRLYNTQTSVAQPRRVVNAMRPVPVFRPVTIPGSATRSLSTTRPVNIPVSTTRPVQRRFG